MHRPSRELCLTLAHQVEREGTQRTRATPAVNQSGGQATHSLTGCSPLTPTTWTQWARLKVVPHLTTATWSQRAHPPRGGLLADQNYMGPVDISPQGSPTLDCNHAYPMSTSPRGGPTAEDASRHIPLLTTVQKYRARHWAPPYCTAQAVLSRHSHSADKLCSGYADIQR